MHLLRSLTALVAVSAGGAFTAFGLPSDVAARDIEHKGNNHEKIKHVHKDIETFRKHTEKYAKNIHHTLEHAKPKTYTNDNYKVNEDLRHITTASHDAAAQVTKDLKGATEMLTKDEAHLLQKTCETLQESAQHLANTGKEMESHKMIAQNNELVREKESVREGFKQVGMPLIEYIDNSKPANKKARHAVKELKKEVKKIMSHMQDAFGARGPTME